MDMLDHILVCVSPIMVPNRPGFDALLQNRILSDVIAAALDLTFGPGTDPNDERSQMYHDWYKTFVIQYVTSSPKASAYIASLRLLASLLTPLVKYKRPTI
jgi:hypothetical protein